MGAFDEQDDRNRLRPRMGKGAARDRVAEGSLGLARLVRHGHGRRGPGRKLRVVVPRAPAGYAPRPNARRAVIKAHVQYLSRHGARAATRHLRYIVRDGVEKDGSPGVLYGAAGETAPEVFEEPRLRERHQFRFIVSPEDGADLDLTAFVRRLMARMEQDLGQPLEWAAVNHHDTEHPHAHLVVRGVDLYGAQLWIRPAYIARGFRWSAQELATESEIQRTFEGEVQKDRLTSLDRELARAAGEGTDLNAAALPAYRKGFPKPETLGRRLDHLARLGLAERATESRWRLAEGWQAELRELGERGDILKQMHRALSGADPSRFHVVRPGQGISDGRGGVEECALVGRVARKGLADESRGTFYAVLETPGGAAYHVPVPARAVDALQPGALVTFSATRIPTAERPVDRHIAEVARARGGAYELAPGGGKNEDERRAVEGRLRELAKVGLAAARGPGQWTVPPDLLAQLAERAQRAVPRYRLAIAPMAQPLEAQVAHRGPVWLDTVDPAALARAGLGADVLRAVERRHEVLRALGIDPRDVQQGGGAAAFREADKRAVGREREARTRERFLESYPERFVGTVQLAPQGAPWRAVSTGARFILVPDSPELAARAGKEIEVLDDPMAERLRMRDVPALRPPERAACDARPEQARARGDEQPPPPRAPERVAPPVAPKAPPRAPAPDPLDRWRAAQRAIDEKLASGRSQPAPARHEVSKTPPPPAKAPPTRSRPRGRDDDDDLGP